VGLDVNGTRFMLYAITAAGMDLARTAMIGRQRLHLSVGELRKNLTDFDFNLSLKEVYKLFQDQKGYAEPLLTLLGARELRSLDVSIYEQATDSVDLNVPIADGFKGRFTAVIDGGSLEHVFNFPEAIKSCMEMLAVGGHFICITPANNFLGHGFYQFSPELFFRIFSEKNGFRVVTLVIFEDRPCAPWFEVADPAVIGKRVELINNTPTYLAVIAQKIQAVSIFQASIYQSDYVKTWDHANKLIAKLTLLSPFVPHWMRSLYQTLSSRGAFSRFKPSFFRKLKVLGNGKF
jgi:SAM-dependent methyltransferase